MFNRKNKIINILFALLFMILPIISLVGCDEQDKTIQTITILQPKTPIDISYIQDNNNGIWSEAQIIDVKFNLVGNVAYFDFWIKIIGYYNGCMGVLFDVQLCKTKNGEAVGYSYIKNNYQTCGLWFNEVGSIVKWSCTFKDLEYGQEYRLGCNLGFYSSIMALC